MLLLEKLADIKAIAQGGYPQVNHFNMCIACVFLKGLYLKIDLLSFCDLDSASFLHGLCDPITLYTLQGTQAERCRISIGHIETLSSEPDIVAAVR